MAWLGTAPRAFSVFVYAAESTVEVPEFSSLPSADIALGLFKKTQVVMKRTDAVLDIPEVPENRLRKGWPVIVDGWFKIVKRDVIVCWFHAARFAVVFDSFVTGFVVNGRLIIL